MEMNISKDYLKILNDNYNQHLSNLVNIDLYIDTEMNKKEMLKCSIKHMMSKYVNFIGLKQLLTICYMLYKNNELILVKHIM